MFILQVSLDFKMVDFGDTPQSLEDPRLEGFITIAK